LVLSNVIVSWVSDHEGTSTRLLRYPVVVGLQEKYVT
jgi:hypothetical protein